MAHNAKSNRDYWEKFYKKNALSVPSQFCVMVATEIPVGSCLVELGCGNGRDSLYFASHLHNVCAMDLSAEAVSFCSESATDLGLSTAHFLRGDLSTHDDLNRTFENARAISGDGDIVGYSRFVMHSMNEKQEIKFLSSLSVLMKSGEKIYFEFRSKEDAALEKTFGGHYRRFIDTTGFIKSMVEKYGFILNYALTGRGMAKYKSEDPYVSRLIFEKV